jgi:sugar phosphate permease
MFLKTPSDREAGETMEGRGKGLYWGWYVVAGAFLVTAINYGARYCFGVFLKPMALEFGWSRGVVSAGISLLTLAYGIGGIFTGRVIDRMSPRRLITIGAILAAAGMILTPLVRSPWQFFLTYGLLGGAGSACFGMVVCSASVGKWFITRRGIAIGTATIGPGVGTMVLAPLAGFIVGAAGWRTGFVCLAVLTLVAGVALAQTLMRRMKPEECGLLPDGNEEPPAAEAAWSGGPRLAPSPGQVLKDPRFWTLAVCYGFSVMALVATIVHVVPYALDLSIDRVAAASTVGMIGMASIAGRFFFGWLSDRLRDPKYAATLGFVFMAAGMGLLLSAGTAQALFLCAVLFGIGYGSLSPMMALLVADRFGREGLGSILGMVNFFAAGVGGSIGPLLAGAIYDVRGSYTPAWGLLLAALLTAAALMLLLRPAAAGRARGGPA